MNRFLKINALLIVSLILVASGFNAALDSMAKSPAQGSYTIYSEKGGVVLAYYGDLNAWKAYAKPGPAVTPNFLHRT